MSEFIRNLGVYWIRIMKDFKRIFFKIKKFVVFIKKKIKKFVVFNQDFLSLKNNPHISIYFYKKDIRICRSVLCKIFKIGPQIELRRPLDYSLINLFGSTNVELDN